MGYRHITEKERYQIYSLLKAKTKPAEIARILKRHPSSISKEVKRNKGLRGYRPKQAHEKATQQASASRARDLWGQILSYTIYCFSQFLIPTQLFI
jgi:IS30 family transposase